MLSLVWLHVLTFVSVTSCLLARFDVCQCYVLFGSTFGRPSMLSLVCLHVLTFVSVTSCLVARFDVRQCYVLFDCYQLNFALFRMELLNVKKILHG